MDTDNPAEEYDLFAEVKFKSCWALKSGRQDIVDLMNALVNIPTISQDNKVAYMKNLIAQIVILIKNHDHQWFTVRSIFNECVGYAIPSDIAIQTIKTWFIQYQQTNPGAKLVDFGAGSGIWELLLHDAGICKESLVAIDLPKEKKTHIFSQIYWPIQEISDYQVDINDILFIAWGSVSNRTSCVVDDYVERGGKCVILLGERDGGCTYPSTDHFQEKDNWHIEEVHVPAGASYYPEALTFNTKF